MGGHCISVDPWFLVDRFPAETNLIRLARERNDGMPNHVVETTMDLLAGVAEPKVAVLGLAYKGNIDDMRESPAVKVVALLQERGVAVVAYDDFVKQTTIPQGNLETCLRGADVLLILTDHEKFEGLDYEFAAAHMRHLVLYDTRNMVDHARWRAAGFTVKVLGVG